VGEGLVFEDSIVLVSGLFEEHRFPEIAGAGLVREAPELLEELELLPLTLRLSRVGSLELLEELKLL
jgi:hypothetical protein